MTLFVSETGIEEEEEEGRKKDTVCLKLVSF
jgi:hypothetical protein